MKHEQFIQLALAGRTYAMLAKVTGQVHYLVRARSIYVRLQSVDVEATVTVVYLRPRSVEAA